MLKILYEDNHIIVAYKPKGILSQADGSNKEDMLTIIKKYIKEKYNKPGDVYLGLVHRLDINTSGVMVFAKTSKAASRLSLQIKNNEFKKEYLAVVEGTLTNKEYVLLESYLKKNEEIKKSFIDNSGKKSILQYKTLSNYKINNKEVSLIQIKLETGRFHQIRCQMSSIGHPLFGDKKYGSKEIIDINSFPLYAYKLTIVHPTLKTEMEFERIENNSLIKWS
jgi:23S rRNA pseudouridine1911/1915/1917 synthase